jgi:hypothetical protein
MRVVFNKKNGGIGAVVHRISHHHSAVHAAGKTRLTQVLRWDARDCLDRRRTASIGVATNAMDNSK